MTGPVKTLQIKALKSNVGHARRVLTEWLIEIVRNSISPERYGALCAAGFAKLSLHSEVPACEHVGHGSWLPYLSNRFNKPGMRILEVGSRNVTGGATREPFNQATYVGFDFYPGENVDVVGDAHKLSTYFAPDEKFDLILSAAVFEHLHMPWIVAEQIAKLLRVGGEVFVETHFAFSAHERPWHFFHFTDAGLRALFNPGLGFEVIESGMSNPLNGVFNTKSLEYLQGRVVSEMYCHSQILCRKSMNVTDFEWSRADLDDIVGETRYPAPKPRANS